MCILYIVPSFRGSPLEHGIFVPCTYYMPYLSTALYMTHLQPAVGFFPPAYIVSCVLVYYIRHVNWSRHDVATRPPGQFSMHIHFQLSINEY